MELIDVVTVVAIFGAFNVILYAAAMLLLKEHEKRIDEKRSSGRRV